MLRLCALWRAPGTFLRHAEFVAKPFSLRRACSPTSPASEGGLEDSSAYKMSLGGGGSGTGQGTRHPSLSHSHLEPGLQALGKIRFWERNASFSPSASFPCARKPMKTPDVPRPKLLQHQVDEGSRPRRHDHASCQPWVGSSTSP